MHALFAKLHTHTNICVCVCVVIKVRHSHITMLPKTHLCNEGIHHRPSIERWVCLHLCVCVCVRLYCSYVRIFVCIVFVHIYDFIWLGGGFSLDHCAVVGKIAAASAGRRCCCSWCWHLHSQTHCCWHLVFGIVWAVGDICMCRRRHCPPVCPELSLLRYPLVVLSLSPFTAYQLTPFDGVHNFHFGFSFSTFLNLHGNPAIHAGTQLYRLHVYTAYKQQYSNISTPSE